jgi:hypothetical protein
VHLDLGKETAERWNLISELALAGLFVVSNLVIFVPPWLAQMRAIKRLSAGTQTLCHDRQAAGGYAVLDSTLDRESGGAPVPHAPNMASGELEYFTLAQVRAMT